MHITSQPASCTRFRTLGPSDTDRAQRRRCLPRFEARAGTPAGPSRSSAAYPDSMNDMRPAIKMAETQIKVKNHKGGYPHPILAGSVPCPPISQVLIIQICHPNNPPLARKRRPPAISGWARGGMWPRARGGMWPLFWWLDRETKNAAQSLVGPNPQKRNSQPKWRYLGPPLVDLPTHQRFQVLLHAA